MNITSRDAWHALPARPGVHTIAMSSRTEFVVHYSGGPPDQTVRAIQDWCIQGRGFLDIDYNFLVRGTTGEIYEGRGWTAVGSHCVGHNSSGLGVCVIGTGQLTPAAKTAVRWLYQEAVRKAGHALRVVGHRDLTATSCPGDTIHTWVHDGGVTAATRTLKLTNPYMRGPDVAVVQHIVGTDVDGVYGPLTARAVMVWQDAHHLVDDGIVGPLTRTAMGI